MAPFCSAVVPTKAGTHNHRPLLTLKLVVASFFAPTAPCGYGSRLCARLSRRCASPSSLGRDDTRFF